jgi:hypothetical protein
MTDDEPGARLELLDALVGTWTIEGGHPLLDGVLTGRATFEWLEGHRFLLWHSHSDHPDVPDALAVTGVTDGELRMHYFDSRGVHRVYSVDVEPGTWRFWRDAADLSQRFTATFSADGDTVTGRGRLSRDGVTWDDDLSLTFRRVP